MRARIWRWRPERPLEQHPARYQGRYRPQSCRTDPHIVLPQGFKVANWINSTQPSYELWHQRQLPLRNTTSDPLSMIVQFSLRVSGRVATMVTTSRAVVS